MAAAAGTELKVGLRNEDAALVARCLEGDETAWAALIDKYKRLIYAIPFRYGATGDDADDIFQQVCIELYHELEKLRDAGALRPWLITVTARRSLRWKTRRLNRGEVNLEEAPETSACESQVSLESLERGQMVIEALGRVPPRCRTMIERLFFEDPPRPYGELARELGLARGSIGFIRGRCLDKLRKVLEEMGL
jgi:RNA polymerase sigma factor (sigma-70 family)